MESGSDTLMKGFGSVRLLPFLNQEYWENVFAEEDPWDYANSDYERWKLKQTLSLLPNGPIERALELGCAEGHATYRLAARVGQLTAIDISPTAIHRARARCAGLSNVDFQALDLVYDQLPGNLDLLLCSEVLYYLPLEFLKHVAPKIASSIKPGGYLLLAHANLVMDEDTRSGFDWGHPFGARTIGKVFCSVDELAMVKELRSPLYTIHLLRRVVGPKKENTEAEISEIPFPPDLILAPEVEKSIIWDGAVVTRAEACRQEAATEVPILLYHSIADDGPAELRSYRVSSRDFCEQLRYLRRHGFYSVTLPEWVACIAERRTLRGRPVVITFDDGYRDFLENAWPALQRADFSAVVFVVTEKVGGVADWDALSSKHLELMTWEELRTLSTNGVAIGSHTASHRDLSTLSVDQVLLEGEQARATLRERLGINVEMIALPWTRGGPAVRSTLAKCGYTIVLAGEGCSTLGDDPLNLPRIEIFGHDDIDTFARKIRCKGPQLAAISAEQNRDRAREESRAASGNRMPIHPDYARALASRLDALVSDFVKLQNELLNTLGSPVTLQKTLTMLFCQPVTGKIIRSVLSGKEISPGILLSFDEAAQVTLLIEPKVDHTLSPDTYLNTIRLNFTGPSEWLSLEVDLDWRDLSLAERFQLCLYGQPSRSLNCQAALRFPRKTGTPAETIFTTFELHSDDRNAVASGALTMPDFIELDTTRTPQLVLFFDSAKDFSLLIHYLNVYFA